MSKFSRTSPFGTRRGVAEFDPLFCVPVAIDVGHHEIHEGDMYGVRVYDDDAASGHVIHIHIETPATATPQKRVHLVIEHEASGEHQLSVQEGVTRSSGGTSATPVNRFRGSAKTSACTCFTGSDKDTDKVSSSGGSEIWGSYGGSGRTSGGGDRATVEWILAPATEYLIELTSKAAGINLDLAAIWYEHTDDG